MTSRIWSMVLLVMVSACGGSDDKALNCKDNSEVFFDPPLTEPGDYTISVSTSVLDAECNATIADSGELSSNSCSSADVWVDPGKQDSNLIDGGANPGATYFIDGVKLAGNVTEPVEVHVALNGTEVSSATLQLADTSDAAHACSGHQLEARMNVQ